VSNSIVKVTFYRGSGSTTSDFSLLSSAVIVGTQEVPITVPVSSGLQLRAQLRDGFLFVAPANKPDELLLLAVMFDGVMRQVGDFFKLADESRIFIPGLDTLLQVRIEGAAYGDASQPGRKGSRLSPSEIATIIAGQHAAMESIRMLLGVASTGLHNGADDDDGDGDGEDYDDEDEIDDGENDDDEVVDEDDGDTDAGPQQGMGEADYGAGKVSRKRVCLLSSSSSSSSSLSLSHLPIAGHVEAGRAGHVIKVGRVCCA
jgi:hypothetical protein